MYSRGFWFLLLHLCILNILYDTDCSYGAWLFAGICAYCYSIGGFFVSVERFKISQIEELPCASNSQRIDLGRELQSQTNTAIAKIETSIEYLQKSIEALSQNMQKNKLVLDPFTQSHSPLSITERGMEMLKDTGIDEMFERNWERINNDIEQNVKSNNAYDVQQYCLEQAVVFPEKFLSIDELDKVKIIAYNSGVPLASYMKVVAILSRDRYFKDHGIASNIIDWKVSDRAINRASEWLKNFK